VRDAKYWIDALDLTPHPEGGYYRETYRSPDVVAHTHLPKRFTGDRCFGTSIYFLLDGEEFSAFHRFNQDEIWHFYDGAGVVLHVIDMSGDYRTLLLGRDIEKGECLQVLVTAGSYFAAEVIDKTSFALVGCTVAPGFDFDDFEMPSRDALSRRFPRHKTVIERLTRK
jgi:predicted cupin superfamily sugar epimerase